MELNLRGQKRLINCLYKSSKAFLGELLKLLSKNLSLKFSKHEHFVFIGDLNVGMENEAMRDFFYLILIS